MQCEHPVHGLPFLFDESERWFNGSTYTSIHCLSRENEKQEIHIKKVLEYFYASCPFVSCLKNVYYINNMQHLHQFLEFRSFLQQSNYNTNVSFVWHGSSYESIFSIVHNHFNISKTVNGRSYGNGVYFAQKASRSTVYSNTFKANNLLDSALISLSFSISNKFNVFNVSITNEKTITKSETKFMLLCAVLPGNVLNLDSKASYAGKSIETGFHSHSVSGGEILVIGSQAQILPLYIIEFEHFVFSKLTF